MRVDPGRPQQVDLVMEDQLAVRRPGQGPDQCQQDAG